MPFSFPSAQDQLFTPSGATTPVPFKELVGRRKDIKAFGAVSGAANINSALSAANAAAAVDGSTVYFPPGGWSYTFSLPPTNVLWEFDGPLVNRSNLGGGSTVNFRKATFGVLAGNHPTTRTSLVNITAIAEGSGSNGIAFGDVAHEIRIDKKNWTNPDLAQVGEIDGQFIYARQGGPTTGTKSALGGQCIDVGMTYGAGFLGHYEHVSTVFDPNNSLAVMYQIDIQGGVLNTRDQAYYGHVLNANVGTMDAAIMVQAYGTASWGDILRCVKTDYINYKINNSGKHTWNGANSTPSTVTLGGEADGSVHIRDASGNDLFAVDQSGALTLRSSQGTVTNRKVNVIAGTPNGVVTGAVGDIVIRTDGGTSRALWLKETSSGNTGWVNVVTRQSGVTGSRPASLNNTIDVGFEYFDTSLGKPIWWGGAAWKDATGATV